MNLVFVRHGESHGNVNGQYDMSMAGALTPRGLQQAEELVARLLPMSFDAIVVSPLERAVLTVLPYLKRSGRTAEAWGELAEMSGRSYPPDELPEEVRHGPPIVVPEAALGVVELRPEPEARLLPPAGESYREGQRRARKACGRILALWGGREATVLMVGHACNGARVIEGLLDIEMTGRFSHGNVCMTEIKQKPNGDFVVRYANRPPEPPAPSGGGSPGAGAALTGTPSGLS